uniref:DNA modification methylase n=1 Tax=candidate division CPR3 bacterium TaxID=2268181 RepID=A0A7V3N5U7_UNCC3
MKFQDLIKLYEEKKKQYKAETFKYISELLREAKELHKKDWQKLPTPNKDHEQSWRAFKGKNLEKLVIHIIKDEVENLGLKIVEGNTLERKNSNNLSEELNRVKRNLLIDYGEFGFHLPDVDIIIYEPKTCEVIAVVSSKVTLRERIAQTGYWKIKLSQNKITKHIKVFFVTPDEDKTLCMRKPAKKGRAIVEVDTDGSYVMSEEEIEESKKVKKFDKFLVDLKNLIYAKRSNK